MRPSLAAPLLPSLSLLILLTIPSIPGTLSLPIPRDEATQGLDLRALELLEEHQARAAEDSYRHIAPGEGTGATGQILPAAAAAVPLQGSDAAQPVAVPSTGDSAASSSYALGRLTNSFMPAMEGEVENTMFTIERKDAEAALLHMETVKRGLESLEALLKSAASLTRLSAFRGLGTPPEPPTLRTPPKALSDDPALHKSPRLRRPSSPENILDDVPDLMHNEHAHLADLYYGAYPSDELFYNKDVHNDLREPVPLVPVNVEKFRDYSAHPRMTAEEFFGRNRKKGTH
ncbi:hypothetical protein DACRYDRAFT_102003 [Dacryopinax primogenitus]|uniref:Uncharacterized protein n=1 Tax=Dacryopinax primogenitus (strain DJM 731) TaxID=1858805 RepID=M5FSD0_DACPD|nr:uncharacterized protein DACRYDRAFT_102003 [Dacryopinax primogenitus]EJT98084.1 hypothetical protein DACRYDRAFT_102003 [Dacryopinax primogenitus]